MRFERLNGTLRRLFGTMTIDAGRGNWSNDAALTIRQSRANLSNLLDIQVDTESKFAVSNTGTARFGTYLETGAVLPFVADGEGEIEIPLDGRVYALTITDDCDLTHAAIPTSPAVGSTIVYVEIDTADDPVITLDAAWHWPDSAVTDVPNADNAKCELLLNVSPQGWVIARVTALGVPA